MSAQEVKRGSPFLSTHLKVTTLWKYEIFKEQPFGIRIVGVDFG